MEPESILWEGILALQRGDREHAGALLVKYTRSNPGSAEGWLWLSRCLDDPKEIEFCLRKAGKLDPALAASFTGQAPSSAPKPANPTQAAPAAPAPSAKAKIRLPAISPRWRRAALIGFGLLVLLIAGGGWWYARDRQAKLSALPAMIEQAQAEIENCGKDCDYPHGTGILDQVLTVDPDQVEARCLRALALYQQAETSLDQDQGLDQLERAWQDSDRCIALTQPPDGQYYVLRYRILHAMAGRQDFRADGEALLEAALENLNEATYLGKGALAGSDLPLIYYQLGRCDEGFDAYERLARPEQPDAALQEWIAVGEITCHGSLGDALFYLQDSLAVEPDALRPVDQRAFEVALVLYYQDRLDEALAELDEQIEAAPQGNGERYYLRGLILYEQGYTDLAREDLAAGEANTWLRGGINAYLRSLLALDAGQKDEALKLLQQAEASTLHGIYSPLAQRYRREMEDLGGIPLVQKSRLRIRATPIGSGR